ncbi:MAG TPA: hypothetical protein VE689_10540 [Candidatus Udaeobacter sp.]|nr:hypothetical protein [Candidatus Udaeobacter sp.]
MAPWYAISLLVHLLALALWLGGMAFFLVIFGPAVHELRPGAGIRVLSQGRIAFEALSWVGITLVMITGMTNLILRNQMSGAHLGQYYMIVLIIKLFAFIAMLVHHSLQIFKYGPKIVALTTEVSDEAPSWPEPLRSYWQRWFLLLKINAALGPIAILLGLALVRS